MGKLRILVFLFLKWKYYLPYMIVIWLNKIVYFTVCGAYIYLINDSRDQTLVFCITGRFFTI